MTNLGDKLRTIRQRFFDGGGRTKAPRPGAIDHALNIVAKSDAAAAGRVLARYIEELEDDQKLDGELE